MAIEIQDEVVEERDKESKGRGRSGVSKWLGGILDRLEGRHGKGKGKRKGMGLEKGEASKHRENSEGLHKQIDLRSKVTDF